MDFDLKNMDLEFLKETRTIQFSKLVDLQLVDDISKKDLVDKLKTYCLQLDAEIKRRKEVEAEGKKKIADQKEEVKPESFAKDFTSQKIKNMSHLIATEVPIFSSGHDVHTWLNKLESYYKLYVAKDTSGVMEEHFVQSAKSRLCPEYLHSMLSTSDETETFEQVKSYMKKNHASKMSVFQTLDTLWEMDQTESESFRDLGIRLDEKAAEARTIIYAKFKEYQVDSKIEVSQMSNDDIFNLVSGQVFLQILKNKHQVIYNNICNDLDKTWSAKDIALKAMTYSDRMTSNDSKNQATVPDAFAAQRNNNSNSKANKASRNQSRNKNDKEDCFQYTKGHCKYGNNCNRNHSDEARKFYKEFAKNWENKKGGNKSAESKPQNGSKDKSQANSKPASYAAAVGEIPVVPLPTQNFCN